MAASKIGKEAQAITKPPRTEIALLSALGRFQWGTLTVDAVTSESHSYQVTATEHAREKGGPATDDAIPQVPQVTAVAVLTDTPMDSPALPGRSIDSLAQLRALANAGEPLALYTGIAYYPSMLLVSIDVGREDTSAGLRPRLTFRGAEFIDAETVEIPDEDLAPRVVAEVSGETNAGKVTPKTLPADEPEAEAVTGSTAYNLLYGGT